MGINTLSIKRWIAGVNLRRSRIQRLLAGISLGLMLSFMVVPPHPVQAQRGNQSDVSGNIITTSDIAGGLFQSSGDGPTQFRSPLVAAAVNQALNQLIEQFLSGTLSSPSTGLGNTSQAEFQAAQTAIANLASLATLPPATQQALTEATTLSEIREILANTNLSPSQTNQISQTLNQLQSLLQQSTDSSLTAATTLAIDIATVLNTGTLTPLQLQAALAGYNTLVKNANLTFLENPPAEFQVIQKALETLVRQALEAQVVAVTVDDDAKDTPPLSAQEDAEMVAAFSQDFSAVEQSITIDFVNHFGLPTPNGLSLQETRDRLAAIQQATGQKPAASYIIFSDAGSSNTAGMKPNGTEGEGTFVSRNVAPWPLTPISKYLGASAQGRQTQTSRESVLQIMLVTPTGDRMVTHTVEGVTKQELLDEIRAFRSAILSPVGRTRDFYLGPAQQLYDWLIRPIEADLEAEAIDTLIFATDLGLRFIPLAALHDGEQFLIENYSVALMPSFSLTDSRYTDLRNDQVLAMGASEFSDQPPLPAASVEIDTIAQNLWQGESFINEEFTLDNLTRLSQTDRFRIIHLATHAAFQPGTPGQSYIQLWDTRLGLDQVSQLEWGDNPTVDLVVLSACQTAVGSPDAELGFAGFAVQSGAKSALASIWSVNDSGTLGLMTEFYHQLRQQPIKAEALRQAQLAMLKGNVRYEDDQLRWTEGETDLPPDLSGTNRDLTHPYYWSGFTMIGSAW